MKNIIVGFYLWLFGSWKAYQIGRLKTCNECAPERSTCPECKCFKELKVMVWSEKCPRDKWLKMPVVSISELKELGEGRSRKKQDELKEEYFKQMNIQ